MLEELGRNVVAAPLIGSAVGAASALILGGTEAQKKAWLPKIAEGTAIAALAIDEGPNYAPDKITLAATKKGSGYSLSGSKTFVMEGMAADVFVVAARTSGKSGDGKGITLFLVPADAKGFSRKRRQLIDCRGYATSPSRMWRSVPRRWSARPMAAGDCSTRCSTALRRRWPPSRSASRSRRSTPRSTT